MVKIFQYCRTLTRPVRRFRRFWWSLYYGITDFLIILGAAAAIVLIWCYFFIF